MRRPRNRFTRGSGCHLFIELGTRISEGRIVVNTGMGFEAPVHRANYDAVDLSPIRYVILTQGHYDHVGGTDVLSDPSKQ